MLARLALVVVAGAGVQEAAAQGSYPARAVRLLVPYPPGGGTDITSRTVAQRLGETWGQPVVVENRGGANGIIGTDLGAKAKPDGYTLVVVIASHAINASLYRNLPYDSTADFTPISLMARYPFIMTSTASLPVKSVKDLIALAKARPGQLSYASSGNGSGPHLGFELFKSAARIDVVHVPYKGRGSRQHRSRVGAGPVDVQQLPRRDAADQGGQAARAGRHQREALSGHARAADAGGIGPRRLRRDGVVLAARTGRHAAAVVVKVQADVAAALRMPAVHARLSGEGAEPVGSTPEQMGKFMAAEIQKWAKVVRDAKVTTEAF
jgi:tripartite-type tricarboxylate transporter receptor subunit TctC